MRVPSHIEEQLGSSNHFDTVVIAGLIIFGIIAVYRIAAASKHNQKED